MASQSRRFNTTAWRMLPFAAICAAGALSIPAQAELRKFVVICAEPFKDYGGGGRTGPLPKIADIYDAYFDKTKNEEVNGNLPDPRRVDSHAEWWEEVSYGDVTVSGNVYGWISLPWPTFPTGFGGDTGFGSSAVTPWVELQAGFSYDFASGEGFNPFLARFKFDIDGVGEDLENGNFRPIDWPGFGQFDKYGTPLWSPGERYQDVFANEAYDAGVYEWGIDKNLDGRIDVKKKAGSWNELLAADITYAEDDTPPVFNSWTNDTEWFDSNADGQWNLDGFEFFGGVGPKGELLVRGDWGGTEIWMDRNGDQAVGGRAESENGRRASFVEFLFKVFDPQDTGTEYFDEQWNSQYDYPEPFEDFWRVWNPNAHDFVPLTGESGLEYIRNNFPGDAEALIARIGNSRYDAPDSWGNQGNTNNSNKGQNVFATLRDPEENGEQQRRFNLITGSTQSDDGVPLWFTQFWDEWFGTQAPDWDYSIPYVRDFNPAIPIPQSIGNSEQPEWKFEPNRGGPRHNGRPLRGQTFSGAVRPDPKNGNEGLYDGPAEFADLPESIYHSGGDQMFGSITAVNNNARYGRDNGSGDPNGVFPDGIVEAGGPLAYNVHGDGGYDAGNVLTTEFLTWRTDGRSIADQGVDLDGDGVIDFISQYNRDINLDGMIDFGETPGIYAEKGLPGRTPVSNYGVDCFPATPPNGGPGSAYPFNRHRLLEDCVAALDESVDWDSFYTRTGKFGSVISGLVLCPGGTANGMFALPAPSFDLQILTRDNGQDAQNPGQITRGGYYSAAFFDGLGIDLADGAGEGDSFGVGNFHISFAAHEYGHSWEGYPDLYDYDVYRKDFSGAIINNPVGLWCVMAGGGVVHPVPILKQDSGWIQPIDITRELIPAAETTVKFNAWEFDRNRTVKVYSNPLYPSEQFYLWRNSPGVISGSQLVRQAFDLFQPGWGVMIMHVDRRGNEDGLPLQQRLEDHFTYLIVQADGLQQLESGQNSGDNGDPFPGSTDKRQFTSKTDPSNRWYDGQPSGFEILGLEVSANSTDVRIRWSPRELPTFAWIQPPGGISVNGFYQLRYNAYDQYGGTRLEFNAIKSTKGSDLDYDQGIPLGNTTKAPGEVESAFAADVSELPDGTYRFFCKMIPGIGFDNKLENSWSVPRAGLDNTGTGTLEVLGVDPDTSRFERWVVTCVSSNPPGQETWDVVGSLSGKQQAQATTGAIFTSDADDLGRVALQFQIFSGNIPFRRGDSFIFLTTGLSDFSAAVLINEGEVVEPVPPVARARTENNITSGLNPLAVTFRHDESFDPRGASLSYTWDFGDGTEPFTTDEADRPVPHTYTGAGDFTATLTVTNAFDLTSTATIVIVSQEAQKPTVRLTATPTTGAYPLTVSLSGEQTTDPNNGTQGLDFVWTFGDGSPPSTLSRVEHIYTTAGTFRATLTVTNRPYGKSDSKSIDIKVLGPPANQRPTAAFDIDKRSGRAPLTIRFDASRSSDPERAPLQYSWNFGDRTAPVLGGPVVNHTYTRNGTFNATLTVTDDQGQTDTATIAIAVTADGDGTNQAPVARIVASQTQGPAPFTVNFDATSSADPEGGPLSYAWNFGDGSDQVEGAVVSHTFSQARDFQVVLSVRDAANDTGTAQVKISVTSPVDDTSRPDTGTDTDTDTGNGGTAGLPSLCGGAALAPLMLTLAGLFGLRRFKGRWVR